MAFGTKYRATAKDHLGRTVQIDFQQEGHSGGVTVVRLAKDGLKRRWGGGKSDAFGLKPQLRTYRLAARDAAAAEEIATAGSWQAVERIDGVVTAQWEVIREEAERTLNLVPEAAEIAARCGLGRLSEQHVVATYAEARALLDAGPKPLLWWLLTALEKTGAGLCLDVATERSVEGATAPLEELYARPERWVQLKPTTGASAEAKSVEERYDLTSLTWHDVASDVAQVLGGVVAQIGGRWRVIERSLLYSPTASASRYAADAHVSGQPPATVTITPARQAEDRTMLSGGSALQRSEQPEVHVTYDPGETESMLPPDEGASEWMINLGGTIFKPGPGQVQRFSESLQGYSVGEFAVGLVTSAEQVPTTPIISSAAARSLAGDRLGIAFTSIAEPGVLADRSYRMFWRMIVETEGGNEPFYVLRERVIREQYMPDRVELEWAPRAATDVLLTDAIVTTLTNGVEVRVERELPLLPESGQVRWQLLAIFDGDGQRSQLPGSARVFWDTAFVRNIALLPIGGSARTYAIRISDAEAQPGGAAEPAVVRLGTGPSAQHPGCLLTASGAIAGGWGAGSQEKWPLAEHEGRSRLEQARFGQAERRCSYRLTSASPAEAFVDAATGEVFQWTEGEADDLRVSIEGTALEVRVDSLDVTSVPIKTQKQGSFGGGATGVAGALARVIESQDQQLARIAQQNAVATTTEWETGVLTVLWITEIERPQEVLRKGNKILVVDRRSGVPYTFTLAERQVANADYLEIEPYDLGDAYLSPDSGVYPVTADLLNVQTYTAEATRNVIRAGALCELSADTSGTVTSLGVTPLREAVREGQMLDLQRLEGEGGTITFFADADRAKGATELPIRSSSAAGSGGVVIDAAAGAALRISDVQRQTEFLQTAYELTQRVTHGQLSAELTLRDQAIDLRVKSDDMLTALNLNLGGIDVTADRFRSSNFDGGQRVVNGLTAADPANLGTSGWALFESGDIVANQVYLRQPLITNAIIAGSSFDEITLTGGGKLRGEVGTGGAGEVHLYAEDGTNHGTLVVQTIKVLGEIDQVNTNELRVSDAFVVVAEGQTGSPSLNAGIYVERGASPDAYLEWDEGLDRWGVRLGTGTFAPLAMNSGTLQTSLNSDLLDGQHGAFYQNASNLNAGTVARARLSGTYDISITGDASTLDGYDSSAFPRKAENATISAHWTWGTGANIYMNGGQLYLRRPETTGGWARGISFHTTDASAVLGGIGMLGSAESVTSLYLGHGSNPRASTAGLHILTSGNVGIGLTNPSARLHNVGSFRNAGVAVLDSTLSVAGLSTLSAGVNVAGQATIAGVLQLGYGGHTYGSTTTVLAMRQATPDPDHQYFSGISFWNGNGQMDIRSGNVHVGYRAGLRAYHRSYANGAWTDALALLLDDSRNLGIGVAPTARLDVNGSARVRGAVSVDTYVGSLDFASGFGGSGMRFGLDSGRWKGELDDLRVRGTTSIYELEISKIRSGNGSYWFASGAKAERVAQQSDYTVGGSVGTWSSEYAGKTYPRYRLYFERDLGHSPFATYDVVMAQTWNGRDVRRTVGVVVASAIFTTGSDAGRPYADVLLVDGDAPVGGQEFVRIGNTVSGSARQGAVYVTSEDSGAPYLDVIDGVRTHVEFAGFAKTKARLGRLDGLTAFGQALSGYGLYAQRARLTDDVVIGSGSEKIAVTSGGITFTGLGDRFITAISGGTGRIDAARLTIGASTQFAAGYDPTSKVAQDAYDQFEATVTQGFATMMTLSMDASSRLTAIEGWTDLPNGAIATLTTAVNGKASQASLTALAGASWDGTTTVAGLKTSVDAKAEKSQFDLLAGASWDGSYSVAGIKGTVDSLGSSLVLKVRADGKVAQMRMDATSGGTAITLGADQVNVSGIVSLMNGGTTTLITGGALANNSITTEKLVVGGGVNLLPNGDFYTGDLAGWRPWGGNPVPSVVAATSAGVPAGAQGSYVLRISAPCSMFTHSRAYTEEEARQAMLRVVPGEKYRVTLRVAKSADYAATANFRLLWYQHKADGSQPGGFELISRTPSQISTSFEEYAATITVPAGVVGLNLYIYNVGVTAGALFVENVGIYRQMGSTLIENGAITTDHVNTTSLDARYATVTSLNAQVARIGALEANALTAEQIDTLIDTAASGIVDSLGGLAFKDQVGASLLDETLIVGGYLKTSLIDVQTLVASQAFITSLAAQTVTVSGTINAASGTFGARTFIGSNHAATWEARSAGGHRLFIGGWNANGTRPTVRAVGRWDADPQEASIRTRQYVELYANSDSDFGLRAVTLTQEWDGNGPMYAEDTLVNFQLGSVNRIGNFDVTGDLTMGTSGKIKARYDSAAGRFLTVLDTDGLNLYPGSNGVTGTVRWFYDLGDGAGERKTMEIGYSGGHPRIMLAQGLVGGQPWTPQTLYIDGHVDAMTVTCDGVIERSDARLKSDVRDLSDALAVVERLRGRAYTMHRRDTFGLVAQEVQSVLPELVREDAGGYLSLHYTGLIPYLIEAIKTLTTRVKALES